eukprot:gene17310-19043_t
MKFIAIFGLVLIAVAVSEATVSKGDKDAFENAKKAKSDYDDEKEKPGIANLKDAISDDGKFGKILSFIRDAQICLRRGTEAKNACYAMSDFGLDMGKILQNAYWFGRPYSHQKDKTNRWYEKLYNSVAKILLLEKDDDAPILLASGGGDSGGEEYKVDDIGIGAAKTFSKAYMGSKGKQFGKGIKLNVKDSFKDMKGAVKTVLEWIEKSFDDAEDE